jgi:hypothetical protein
MPRHILTGAWTACLLLLSTASAATASNPVHFNAHWGGIGVVAGHHHENLCSKNEIEPGGHRQALVLVNGPGDAVAHGPNARDGTLLCAPVLAVWPFSTGPWEGGNWISLRCPAGEKPIDGGAGFQGGDSGTFTQAGGGFGDGHDGYWHYRFFNHSRHTYMIKFWAVCVGHRWTRV